MQYSRLIRLQGLQKYPPPNKVPHSILSGGTLGINEPLKSVGISSNKLSKVGLWNFCPFLLTKRFLFSQI